eukprot:scaffold175595_cov24-Prasinocladus_malaysianus.AAC.1
MRRSACWPPLAQAAPWRSTSIRSARGVFSDGFPLGSRAWLCGDIMYVQHVYMYGMKMFVLYVIRMLDVLSYVQMADT